ncbi:MAG: Maf family protein [Neisseria sp.]|nr:Maf family protein [Neisseria sp.]
MINRPTVYLASGSPRRREILENLGFSVERLSSDIDETPFANENAERYVLRMAQEKNRAALHIRQATHDTPPPFPVLSADTAVALNGYILGKPENNRQAAEMLRSLSGGTHQVLTAVCISFQGRTKHCVQISNVFFKTLSETEIAAYIRSGEPTDKAGAYGIQGLGGVFIDHLSGSFTGVMGLPVRETCALLSDLGCATPPFA